MAINQKYITLKNLIDDYAHHNGGPVQMLYLLGYYLRQGDLMARVHHRWISEDWPLSAALKNEPRKEKYRAKIKRRKIGPRSTIPRSVWLKSVDWQNDMHLWKVAGSVAVVTTGERGRTIMRGLRILSK